MKTKVLAFVLAAGTAMALSAGAQADDRTDGKIFCASIGLSQANQATCTKQLVNASSDYDRQSIQTKWVARSGKVAGPEYHVRRDGFVPNRVVAQINRAVNAALTAPEWQTQVAQTEKSLVSDTAIEYAN